MKFTLFGNKRQVNVNVNRYKINWHEPSASKIQTEVKVFLYPFWKNCIVLEEFVIPGSRLRCDFINLNKKIAIEVHGEQHFEYNKHFHRSRFGWMASIKRDMGKLNWLENEGFRVIELIEEDIKQISIAYIQSRFGIFIA